MQLHSRASFSSFHDIVGQHFMQGFFTQYVCPTSCVIMEEPNASVQRPCQRPDRKYTRCESTQTITAGTYAETAERGQGRAATVC